MFTDLAMRAVHIEAVFGYDTSNYPQQICKSPWMARENLQLSRFLTFGAERELEEAWQRIDQEPLQRNPAQDGSTWVFGPTDSLWYQREVESLIKSAKLAIHFEVSKQCLSVH